MKLKLLMFILDVLTLITYPFFYLNRKIYLYFKLP